MFAGPIFQILVLSYHEAIDPVAVQCHREIEIILLENGTAPRKVQVTE